MPWQKGKSFSSEHRLKISLSSKGKKHAFHHHKPFSEETKKKMRIAAFKRIERIGYVFPPGLSHVCHSQTAETRAKISKTEKGRVFTLEWRDKISMARLKQILPQKDTTIEIKLQQALRERGTVFEKHYPIKGLPDIVLLEQKIAVFCDGCYWHGCPIHFPGRINIKNDAKVTADLVSKGWRVIRFWEHEINTNLEECVNKIEQELGPIALCYR